MAVKSNNLTPTEEVSNIHVLISLTDAVNVSFQVTTGSCNSKLKKKLARPEEIFF